MRLFICKKYNFLIEKNLPSLPKRLSPPPKIRETRVQRFLRGRVEGTQAQSFLELSKHLPMGRCLSRSAGRKFQGGFVVIPTDFFGSKYLWGW